jgi:hypothetical protein
MLLRLRTVIYHVPDLDAARKSYSAAFAAQPYFDEPFYVGFNIGGFELDPDVRTVPPGTAAPARIGEWSVPSTA